MLNVMYTGLYLIQSDVTTIIYSGRRHVDVLTNLMTIRIEENNYDVFALLKLCRLKYNYFMELFIESSTLCETVASGSAVYLEIIIVPLAGMTLCQHG
jgi:hypothetical protein